METTLTEAELEAGLRDALERVRSGERVVVERDGQAIAVIAPPKPRPGITGREILARLGDLRMPGDGYADDIEAARADLAPAVPPAWPD